MSGKDKKPAGSRITFREVPILLVGAADAAKMIGTGRTAFLRNYDTGEIGPKAVRLGGRVLWSVDELVAWAREGCPSRGTWLELWKILRRQ
jgi:predicted DNA-binding transcriptional regulator AlpA